MAFKKGDRVRFLEDSDVCFTKGKIYTVVKNETSWVRIVADDNGDARLVSINALKLVRRRKKSPKKTKVQIGSFQCGFRNLYIEPPQFGKLLSQNDLSYTNRTLVNNEFLWGFEDGYIVTTNDPLMGTSADGSQTNIGYAENVGVEGTEEFRDRVTKFLKRHAYFNDFDPSFRRFA
jgi:hypothetical protein